MINFFKSQQLYNRIAVYLGTAWVLIEATGYFTKRYDWPDRYEDVLIFLLGLGLIPFILIEWSSYRKRSQIGPEIPKSIKTDQPSIAVLPFEDLSPQKNNEWLGDGICDRIIDQLSQVNSLSVKSRSASFYFKNKDIELSKIADILGVNQILEGSILVIESMLRISVKLIDPFSGKQSWNKTFENQYDDIFNLQSQIALSVAEKVKAEIKDEEMDNIKTPLTTNIDAYEAYMKGLYHYRLMTPTDSKRALDYFAKATDIDPDFADGYAYMGLVYNMYGGQWLDLPSDLAYGRANEYAQKTINIHPAHPIGLFLKANITFFYERDLHEGLRLAAEAYDLEIYNEDIVLLYALMLTLNEKGEESLQLINAYLAYNPVSSIAYMGLGNVRLVMKDFEGVLAACQRALELDPSMIRAKYLMAEAYLGLGQYADSHDLWMALYKSTPIPVFLEGLFRCTFIMGNKEKANNYLEKLVKMQEQSYSPYMLAKAYATLGNKDKVFQYLEEAWNIHEIELVSVRYSDAFKSLRNDPRFKALVNRFNYL